MADSGQDETQFTRLLFCHCIPGWRCSGRRILSCEDGNTTYTIVPSCHGVDADGRGPTARALKAYPPDLRYLGERYGMPLPTGTIARFIDGRQYVVAHGPRDMPVWGRHFYDIWTAKQSSEGDLQVQIRDIARYVNAIQEHRISSGDRLLPNSK
jgi:hypothetical protein